MKHNKDDQDQQHDLPDTEISGVDDSRRKFNKAAGAVAPVLLSLSSRPVWAAADCHFSGPFSGNQSHQCKVVKFDVGYLQDFSQSWPKRAGDSATLDAMTFDAVFGKFGDFSLFGASATLRDVLKNTTTATQRPDDGQLKNKLGCSSSPNGLNVAVVANVKQHIAAIVNNTVYGQVRYSYDPSSFKNQFTSISCVTLISNLNSVKNSLATQQPIQ